MKKLYALAILLFFIAPLSAGFELRSFKVSLTLNPDGSAHASEVARLFIDGNSSIRLYEDSILFNDLSSWISRTEIGDLRTHVSRAYVDIVDLRVRPQPVEKCNNLAETCYATIILDYDIYPIDADSAGLVITDTYKPRTTKYSLRSEAFSFSRSKTDGIILPKGYEIEIAVPEDSKFITFSRVPDNVPDESSQFRYDSYSGNNYYLGSVKKFSWSNQTLSQFSLTYEMEQSLEGEISSFFSDMQSKIFLLIFSESGIAYILAAISLILPAIWLHSLEKK